MIDVGIDFEAIEAALVAFAEAATGVPAVWQDDDNAGPQNDLPFVGLSWLTLPSAYGDDDEDTYEDEALGLITARTGPRRATISMHVYSKTARPGAPTGVLLLAARLDAALSDGELREEHFTPAGFGLGETSDVRYLPEQRDGTTQRVHHAQLDVDLHLAVNAVANAQPDIIESVEVVGQISGVNQGELVIPPEDE